MIDDVSCLVIITAKDDNNIAAVQFKIKPLNFYCWSTQLTDLIYTDLWAYRKLSRCTGQIPCLFEHYLVTYHRPWSQELGQCLPPFYFLLHKSARHVRGSSYKVVQKKAKCRLGNWTVLEMITCLGHFSEVWSCWKLEPNILQHDHSSLQWSWLTSTFTYGAIAVNNLPALKPVIQANRFWNCQAK